jgi:Tol biopolymer transport system component
VFGSGWVRAQYGYQIVSYAGARYGRDLWTSALDYTARNPFLIWPLALHLKKQYGMYKSSLYQLTMDSLKHLYNNDKRAVNYINYLPLNKEQRSGFTQYTLPKDLDNGDIMVLKSGLDYPDRFVLMDSSGNEKVILTTGYFPGFRLDVHHNRVVWDEIVTDPRWERRDYSEIRVLDLQTGKPRALTRRTRYFSPAFSPGGQLLVVAETDHANNHFITLLDAFSGDTVQRIPSPFNHAVQQPVWAGDSAVVLTVSDRENSLGSVFTIIQQDITCHL